ncbi:MAG TPA: hypothetical protein DCS07_02540 [Bdellovibrionales bacterium]|nr:MAG: hypothetical protein A2Z97_15275 [Bdellovibrionales bacterium GWB1_52_6]OFZ05942.1 MAG: hypothetical protein A2X97_01220 [Bdellovibrionales bacterium GWA1_52_35]OFZ37095.1 MAG: hypothetical protein A2070_06420 [Bdellovibrionales bacterium GWC1_52_8]HAR41502.1 hypothetical protein [Bdellovibrionales bacterium]HCM39440.1 hypothetical protein [Bdellovibrionales bacterium]
MKINYRVILQDGLVLITVSTLFVVALSTGFKSFKKDVDLDAIVLALNQDSKDEFNAIVAKEPGPERLNRKDEFGRTPLMMAAYANYKDLKQREEMDSKRVSWIEILASSGADLNAVDKDGWTPLMFAAWSGMNLSVAKLVELGASVTPADRQGNTALSLAAFRGQVGIVKLLVEKGATKDAVTVKGKKALDLAQDGLKQYPERASEYSQVVELLL